MSKTCAICGNRITILSENYLSKNHKNIKICFTCYEYAATGLKGNKEAIETLKKRYKDNISLETARGVESLFSDKTSKHKGEKEDKFMQLLSNDMGVEDGSEKQIETDEFKSVSSFKIREQKLYRIQQISTIMIFLCLLAGLLLSFYFIIEKYDVVVYAATAALSVITGIVFYCIKSIVSALIGS